jgi:hypothetical protein
MGPHFHVIENTPGYLPDSDEPPFPYTSLDAARSYAQERADSYRSEAYQCAECMHERKGHNGGRHDMSTISWIRHAFRPLYSVSGNRTEGYVVSDNSHSHDLGRVIYVTECAEDCEVAE